MSENSDIPSNAVFSIGHSTRPVDMFIDLLRPHDIKMVVDVRNTPRSRYNPQYNADALEASLQAAGIAYTHLKALGGMRKPAKDSINAGWKNAGFRGYADYMQTPAFEAAFAQLLELAQQQRIAMMCAEAIPWRCHRSLLADAFTVRGIPVYHLMSGGEARLHRLTDFAVAEGTRLTYPPQDDLLVPQLRNASK